MTPLQLMLLPERLAVCRLDPGAAFPAWVMHAEASFWSVTRTPEEISIVCEADSVPPSVTRVEVPWRAFRVRGSIPFTTTGILSGLTAPLAEAGIPVFAFSTWETDYVLVKQEHLERAVVVLASRFVVDR